MNIKQLIMWRILPPESVHNFVDQGQIGSHTAL